ncbi:MAG: DUF4167 domain-containing protein [Xanthobacteraceae bacterium]
MRNGQNKRMRGRNGGRKNQNPLTRVYESNGPDVKIRGAASHIAEKYIQLARDAQGSGDPVAAENYYQHAEHYFRLIAAAQEQFRQGQQQQPFYRPDSAEPRDESFDDEGDDQSAHPMMGGGEPNYGNREHQQSYPPRDGQQHQQRDQQPHHGREHQNYPPRDQQPRSNQPGGGPSGDNQGDMDRLPSFITGGGQQHQQHQQQQQQQQHQQQQQQHQQGYGQNGHDGQPDRFPLHRRRRRHRGQRGDMPGGGQRGDVSGGGPQGGDDTTPLPRTPQD